MEEPMWKSIIADSVKAEQSRQEEGNNTEKHYDSMTADEELEAEVMRRKLDAERKREQRRRAEQIRIRQNRIIAFCAVVTVIMIIISVAVYKSRANSAAASESSSAVSAEAKSKTKKAEASSKTEESTAEQKEQGSEHKIEQSNGMTFVDDILIVNKTYSLPDDYAPGVSQVALNAFNEMAEDASADGISLWINSGYRSYQEQEELYNSYALERGTELADEVSSRPGHSEHQTGLAFDVNDTSFDFENSAEAEWLTKHCAEYGFIIRFPDGKEKYTGYTYEPWHIRYLGTKLAKEITDSGLSLEEYLDITSEYAE